MSAFKICAKTNGFTIENLSSTMVDLRNQAVEVVGKTETLFDSTAWFVYNLVSDVELFKEFVLKVIKDNVTKPDADKIKVPNLIRDQIGDANRTINVPKSTNAQALAGTDDSTAMTPLRVKESIVANVPQGVGVGQTWQAVTRTSGVTYRNDTGKPIQLYYQFGASNGGSIRASPTNNGTDWITIGNLIDFGSAFSIVPDGWWYQLNGAASSTIELR